jgi:hypothetical protein
MTDPVALGEPAAARRLILAGLRCRLADTAPAECAALARDPALDWAELLDQAEAERVAPLLHLAWRGAGWLPPGAAAALRQAYMASGAQNALLLRDLGRVLDRLAAAGVPALALKGAALLERRYGNPALRPMTDIDLLVQAADLGRAQAALAGLGLGPDRQELAPGARLRFENEVRLVGRDPLATPVELHWLLLDAPRYQARLEHGWFWSSAIPVPLAGRPGRALGTEAELLYLCAHLGLHHGGQGLLWYHDVAELVHADGAGLDWALLTERAAASELVLPLQSVLARVARDWGCPPPPEALARLRALVPSAAEARWHARRQALGGSVGGRFAEDLGQLPNWGERLAFAARNLFPNSSYMRARYRLRHPAALLLAYPYRWARGLWSIRPRRGGG